MSDEAAVIVVDKRSGWRVVHPSPFSYQAVCFILFWGGFGSAAIAVGVDQLVRFGKVGLFALLLCFGLGGWAFIYGFLCAPYVAFDEHHVAQGNSRRRPKAVVARADISRMTRGSISRGLQGALFGQLVDEDGNVLMRLNGNITTRQLANLARELQVPSDLIARRPPGRAR
jgi:hypothetical protein